MMHRERDGIVRLFTATLVVSVVFLLGAVAAQEEDLTPISAFDPSEEEIENGRAIAVGAYTIGYSPDPQAGACFQCHGMQGEGDGAAAFPRLTDQTFKYLYGSLKDYTSKCHAHPTAAAARRYG